MHAISNTKEGTPPGWIFVRKPDCCTERTVSKYPPVSHIAARKKQIVPPAHRWWRGVPSTTTSVLLVYILPGYLLSATRCLVDWQTISGGVVTLGESLRLVAAGGFIDPKLYTRYELTYDAMIQQKPTPRMTIRAIMYAQKNERRQCVYLSPRESRIKNIQQNIVVSRDSREANDSGTATVRRGPAQHRTLWASRRFVRDGCFGDFWKIAYSSGVRLIFQDHPHDMPKKRSLMSINNTSIKAFPFYCWKKYPILL